jgi:hypothetical protein
MTALRAEHTTTNFTVNWTGGDAANGSGLKDYGRFVSENGSQFVPVYHHYTPETSATFRGSRQDVSLLFDCQRQRRKHRSRAGSLRHNNRSEAAHTRRTLRLVPKVT